MLYQISWRAARKADKHGECGGQQLNSVLTVQLMGFFCCSNEIFLQGCGEICPETGRRCAHAPIHRRTDNIRHAEKERMLKKNTHTVGADI